MSAFRGRASRTLWALARELDPQVFEYTVGDDPIWDARLLRWDVLGSLGHVKGLRAARLLSNRDYSRLRAGLRAALEAVARGELRIARGHEDVHSAVEDWLTRRLPGVGERLHTGRSRNDQIACDLRLYLKDALLQLHHSALELAEVLLRFAARHRAALWPGYTHQRRAMPSSAGLWALAFAEGLLDTVEALPALWASLDRSPLGSAAGYGAPVPLRREVVARALGFAEPVHAVTAVQNGRGKLDAAVLFWCTQLGHEVGKLAQDVVILSSEEFGFVVIPESLATGSSIMPHKRNPDLFELTRARAAAVEGDLAAVLRLKAGLGSGYHRDFQLLKEPLFRGLDRTAEMLRAMVHAIPLLEIDRARAAAALEGGALATDEVMRRVEQGRAFRLAYREVAAEIRAGKRLAGPSRAELIARRQSIGNLGNLGLSHPRGRLRRAGQWGVRQRRRFEAAMARLAGRRVAGARAAARGGR